MLQTKLKGDDELKKIDVDGDMVALLKKIIVACRQMNTNASLYDAINGAKRRHYEYRQMPEDNNETNLRAFKSDSDVIEHYKGDLYGNEALIDYEKYQDRKNRKNHTDKEIRAIVKDNMMSTALIK